MQTSAEDNLENNLKWPSIPLLIPIIAYLIKKQQYKKLNEIIFKQEASATQKYDGTNVGKDEHGVMYGRNLLIPDKTNSYQSTPIKCVRSCNTQLIKNLVLQRAGIHSDDIQKFVIYGELMCNKGLYNYTQDKLASTHQVFGGVIKTIGDPFKVAEKLAQAQFAFIVRNIDDSQDEDQDEDQGDKNQNKIIMLLMNQTLAETIANNVQIVPSAGHYQNLYELINSNYEWMLNGMGEGLVIISPTYGQTSVRKWKNGSEASATNLNNLNLIIQAIEDDQEFAIFGNQTLQAKELFKKMLEVEMSKLINGQVPQIVSKVLVQPKVGVLASLDQQEREQYLQAIGSAKTKFDNCDVYFQKNIKGLEEYSQLISQECLTDIQIDKKDKQQTDRHLAIVKEIIKEDFVIYKKSISNKK